MSFVFKKNTPSSLKKKRQYLQAKKREAPPAQVNQREEGMGVFTLRSACHTPFSGRSSRGTTPQRFKRKEGMPSFVGPDDQTRGRSNSGAHQAEKKATLLGGGRKRSCGVGQTTEEKSQSIPGRENHINNMRVSITIQRENKSLNHKRGGKCNLKDI